MQLLLSPGQTGTVTVGTTPIYLPITTPVIGLGVEDVGALVEIPQTLSVNLSAQLAYRWYSSDDSQSAGSWSDLDTPVNGPGKTFKKGSPTGGGLFIQLGIKLVMSSGTSEGRAWLRYPTVVTK